MEPVFRCKKDGSFKPNGHDHHGLNRVIYASKEKDNIYDKNKKLTVT